MMEFDEKEIWMYIQLPTHFNRRTRCYVGYKEFKTYEHLDRIREDYCKEYGFTIRLTYPDVVLCHSGTRYKFNFHNVPNSDYMEKRIYPYDDKKSYKPFDINEVIIIKRDIHYEFVYRDISCITAIGGFGRSIMTTTTVKKHCIRVNYFGGPHFKIYDDGEGGKEYRVSIDKAIIPIERMKRVCAPYDALT